MLITVFFQIERFVVAAVPVICCLSVSMVWAGNAAIDSADVLIGQERYDEARQLLAGAIEHDPENHRLYYTMARLYLRMDDGGKAVKYAKEAVELADTSSACHTMLGHAYGTKAGESLGSLNPMGIGHALDCREEYGYALELDPTNLEAMWGLMFYHLIAPRIVGGDKDEAEDMARSIEAEDSLSGAFAWAVFWESKKNKEYDKAEDYYRRAVALDTSSTYDGRYALSIFLFNRERYEEASTEVEEILELAPGQAPEIAKTISGRFLNDEEALEEDALAWLLYTRGLAYEVEGRADEAAADFSEAASLLPGNPRFQSKTATSEGQE
jgi:tetratricopeptide (TPR) repeat protein